MRKQYFLGVDPGKSGGWALKKENKILVGKMPLVGEVVDVSTIAKLISDLGSIEETAVIIEKVHAMPKQGVSSTFTFGVGYGKLLGMCQTLGVSFHLVTPQEWKKKILSGTKKDKNAAIEFVRNFFPDVSLILPNCKKHHDGIADAVCIMQWGLEKYGIS